MLVVTALWSGDIAISELRSCVTCIPRFCNSCAILRLRLNVTSFSKNFGANVAPVYNVVITGSLLAIIPLIIAFLFLQRYWQSGLASGGIKA